MDNHSFVFNEQTSAGETSIQPLPRPNGDTVVIEREHVFIHGHWYPRCYWGASVPTLGYVGQQASFMDFRPPRCFNPASYYEIGRGLVGFKFERFPEPHPICVAHAIATHGWGIDANPLLIPLGAWEWTPHYRNEYVADHNY